MIPTFAQHREHLNLVVQAILHAADPALALQRAWPSDPILQESIAVGVLVAAGKASMAMAQAALEICGPTGMRPNFGIVVAPPNSRPPKSFSRHRVRMCEADHPLPAQRNLVAAQAVADAARLAGSRGLPLVVLLSGGASAHLTMPERGLTLSDVRAVTDALLRAGASITQLNTVRKHLELLKGGGLAAIAAPSAVHAFVLSDVVGDDLAIIASGPTCPDQTTPQDALRILQETGVQAAVPHVVDYLKKRLSTPTRSAFGPIHHTLVASNQSGLLAASATLTQLGFEVIELKSSVTGFAADQGRALAQRLLAARAAHRGPAPIAFVWGGETTVHVRGSGFGGRNQEAAFAAAQALDGQVGTAVLCLATDGVDGTFPPGRVPHAGAIITGQTWHQALRAGADPAASLERSDSYSLAELTQTALTPGPTGTNICDVWVAVAY